MTFFVALGVSLGGSLLGALGAALTGRPPVTTLINLASDLKIWAIAAALGGTFGLLKNIKTGVMEKQFLTLLNQLILLWGAFCGAHLGYLIILSIAKE